MVRAGGGSARDTLSVLDQLIGGAGEDGVTYALTAALLGFTPDSLLDEVVDALAGQDAGSVFAAVDKVVEAGQDPRRFTEDLLQRFRDLVIITAVPDASASGLIDVPEDQAERLVAQAARFGSHDLARYAELVAAGLADLKSTTAPRLLLELLCARLLLPGVDDGTHGLAARLDRMEKRLSITGAVSDHGHAPPAPRPARRRPRRAAARAGTAPAPGRSRAPPEPPPEAPAAEAPARAPAQAPGPEAPPAGAPAHEPAGRSRAGGAREQPTDRRRPRALRTCRPPRAWGPRSAGSSRPRSHAPRPPTGADGRAAPTAAAAARGSGTGGLTLTDLRRLWPEVVEAVKSQRRVTWIQLSQHAQVIGLDGRTLTIGFNNAGARESFVKGRSDVLVQQVLIDLVGQEWVVDAINDPSAQPGGTPDRVHKAAVPRRPGPSERPEAGARGDAPRPASNRPDSTRPDSRPGPAAATAPEARARAPERRAPRPGPPDPPVPRHPRRTRRRGPTRSHPRRRTTPRRRAAVAPGPRTSRRPRRSRRSTRRPRTPQPTATTRRSTPRTPPRCSASVSAPR